MNEQPLDQLTLRQLCTHAERLTRELIEHLDQDFIPKTQNLEQLVHPKKQKLVGTVTLRNHSSQVLESEKFSDELYQKLDKYFTAIDQSVARLVEGT